MGFWYNRGPRGGSFKNMSVPPRTEFVTSHGVISSRAVVFSFPLALHKFCGAILGRADFAGPVPPVPQLLGGIRQVFPEPESFFGCVGRPLFPAWDVDFLIGSRFGNEQWQFPERVGHVLCEDPLLCAGVLSRCVGTLYLSRRVPELTWERLLVHPVLFDDPLIAL